ILDFSHRKFFDAQTYTAITFLDKKPNDAILYDRIKPDQSPESFLLNANGSTNSVKDLNVKKWRLLKQDEQQIIRTIESLGTPIGTLFDIAVGIATLKDDVYFIDGRQEIDGYYTKSTDNGTFRIEESVTRAVHKISEFTDQSQITGNTRRIICPYEIVKGTAKLIAFTDFERNFPACLEYLISERERLATRDKGKMVYDPFFAWGRTQGLTKQGKKILTPTFSKFPRFLLVNDEGSFFTNGYGIFFKNAPRSLFDDFSNPLSIEANMDVVQKILNSSLMHYYVTKTSFAIEGGYPCYQKNFIERFTIPLLSDDEIAEVRAMSSPTEIDRFLCEKYE
ncbi:MAG: DNA methyltransferase, partial [Pyrinomonadaceae bacterium]